MDKRVEKAILYIAQNHRSDIVLDDLARESGLSKFHLHRLFTLETGLTPLAYIRKVRMEHASHFAIMFPESKQLEIAFECGYSSPAVFARTFRQYFGTTVMRYRKEKRKKKSPNTDTGRTLLPITWLPQKHIPVYPSNLRQEKLAALYNRLITENSGRSRAVGFFIDAPMHATPDEARYFAGLENETAVKSPTTLTIEEGYYTYLDVQGDFDHVTEQIIRFKEDKVDPSPYYIASLVGFEKILLPVNQADFDYFSAKRTIFMHIKRK